jgi:serine/threonine protein kinase
VRLPPELRRRHGGDDRQGNQGSGAGIGRYLWNGSTDVRVKALSPGGIRWLPLVRYQLTPFGTEAAVTNHFAGAWWPTRIEVRVGRAPGARPWGIGVERRARAARPRISRPNRRCFDREARAIAAFSHPNVCAIFDVGHDQGIAFLVMEYLEGETLAARLERGGARTPMTTGPSASTPRPGSGSSTETAASSMTRRALPIAETIRVATALADALAAAHRAGIVHRDLKPGNIMLTRAGVKVLDFGLARMVGRDGAPDGAAATMTVSPLTGLGMLLGTMPYMSPEQLEGKDVDTRSDIFALGAVIYEMATGRRAFEGTSHASLIAAILDRHPTPISDLQPLAPAGLDQIVRTCLEKDPDDRWQHAGDISRQLKWLSAASDRRASSTAVVTDERASPLPRSAIDPNGRWAGRMWRWRSPRSASRPTWQPSA